MNELIWGCVSIIFGLSYLLFSEKIIALFKEDRYIDHKQNKLTTIISGAGLVLLGLYLIYFYISK